MADFMGPAALGMAAAAFWGSGDFLVNIVSRRVGTWTALFQSHLIALILVGGAAAALGQILPVASPTAWTIVAVGAVLNLVMIASLYRALELGPLPVVAPIVSSYAGIAALLSFMSGIDTVSAARGACLAAIFAGVVLTAIEKDGGQARPRSGVGWALLCAGAGGANAWLQGFVIVPAIGAFWTLIVDAAVVTLVAGAVGGFLASRTARPTPATLALGVCIAAGFLSYFLGLETGALIIVNVLSSMCAAVTALLGAWLLGHRIARLQWAGVGVILAGVVALNLV